MALVVMAIINKNRFIVVFARLVICFLMLAKVSKSRDIEFFNKNFHTTFNYS